EGAAGVGRRALLGIAGLTAQREGRLVLRARGSELESDFAFGIARQLFERFCTETAEQERATLFQGTGGAVKAVVMQDDSGCGELDNSFAVMHGLYWLVVNLASRWPVTLTIDDA